MPTLRREIVGAAAVTIAASRAFVQPRRGMLVDDRDDTAHATPAFCVATHVPEHPANRRAIATATQGFSDVTV